jgi:hypothetical protein
MRVWSHWMLVLLTALLFACQTSKPPSASPPAPPNPPTTPPSPPPPSASGPTSFDLIDDALSAGTLDTETALTYRVFATFNDARLPAQYRGNASVQTEGQDLRDVLETLPSLSPATREKLEPFLIPPIYKSSWLSAPASVRSASLSIRCRDELRDDWYSIARPSGKFRVWYTAGQTSESRAGTALDALEDEIYPALIDRLGLKAPSSDIANDCNGTDEKLDVYLVPNFGVEGTNTANGLTTAKCAVSSSYILVKNELDAEHLKSTLAHEFMHAIQFEYPDIKCSAGYGWLKEATATWAKDFVYPKNNLEHGYAPSFMESPEKALNDPDAKSQKDLRQYGAYVFFQFVTKSLGDDRIKAIFEGSTNTTSLDAVNNNIAGGFKDQWWKFAKTLWNQAPIDTKPDSFKVWDDLAQKPDQREIDGDLKGASEATETLESEQKNLSSRYYHFSFTDPNTRSILFYNGFFDQIKAGKAIKILAIWKDAAGTWQEEDDWSDYKYVGLCRDLKNQRAVDLTVIVANGEKDSGGKVTASKAPYLKRNNVGCFKFEGQVNLLEKHSSWNGLGRKAVENIAFELDPRALALDAKNPQIPDSLRLGLSFIFPLSGTDYTFELSYSTGCSFSYGPASFPLSLVPGKTAGFLLTNPFPELESNDPEIQKLINLPSRAYSATALDNQMISVSVSGQGCHSPQPDIVGGLLLTNGASNGVLLNPPLVKPDGTMQGNFKTSDANFDWTLAPKTQP